MNGLPARSAAWPEAGGGVARAAGARSRPSPAAAPPLVWAGAGLLAAAAWLVLRAWSGLETMEPVCALRQIAHIGCPTCGFTHALVALARGEVSASVAFHPMAVAIVSQMLAAWLAWGWSLARGRAAGSGRWLAHAVALDVAAGLAVWIARLATGTIPA
jgi:hypothetical protein